MKLEGLDSYDLKARLFPVLLAVLPIGLAVLAWMPSIEWGVFSAVITSAGLTVLLSQFGRDLGKRKEAILFDGWGGKPTTQMLRHRDEHIDAHTKARYHKKLTELIPGIEMPSQQQEEENPGRADTIYESCVRYVLEATRDKNKFRLIFSENINYGFRRNFWGIKKLGIVFSLSGLAMVAIFWLYVGATAMPEQKFLATFTIFINAGFLMMWLKVNPKWVRVAAFAYAERLLASVEVLDSKDSQSEQTVK